MSGEVNVIPTLREIRGGGSPSKFGGGQSRDIFRGGPVKKTTLYNLNLAKKLGKFMVASLLVYLYTFRHIGTFPSLSWVGSLLETKDVSWGLLLGVGTAIFDA